jgi:hypothetical protein
VPAKLARLLVVLVAIVVPLQGMATVAASQCMALGHHQDAGHAHKDGQVHEHDGSADGAAAHCGPCSACCASVPIASVSVAPIVPASAIARHLSLPSAPLGVETGGVYRPPLSL